MPYDRAWIELLRRAELDCQWDPLSPSAPGRVQGHVGARARRHVSHGSFGPLSNLKLNPHIHSVFSPASDDGEKQENDRPLHVHERARRVRRSLERLLDFPSPARDVVPRRPAGRRPHLLQREYRATVFAEE